MSKNKKAKQLGMNPSTASARLIKDILFNFIEKKNIKCYHCKKKMTRGDFSIEHKIPWLDSSNPKKLYFDLNNISFSHLSCNISKRRIKRGIKHPSIQCYINGCRCKDCKEIQKLRQREYRKSLK